MNWMEMYRFWVGLIICITWIIYCIPPPVLKNVQYTEDNQMPFITHHLKGLWKYLPIVIVTVPHFISLYGEYSQTIPSTFLTSQELFGLVLFTAGILLHGSCRYYLGQFYIFSFSIIKDQKVISAGPYGVIRHPGYLSNIFVVLGAVVFLNFWWYSIIMILPLMLIGAISKEEKMMQNFFKDEWNQYCRGVKFKLIPYLY